MKPLAARRALIGAAAAVLAQAAGRPLFKAVYASVPEYHAFWSGVVLYAGIFCIWWGPAALALLALHGRTRFAGVAAGLVGVCFIVAFVASGDWSERYWTVYTVLVLAVFMGVVVQRGHDDRDRNLIR